MPDTPPSKTESRFLDFLWHIKYDEVYAEKFKTEHAEVIEDFGLTLEQVRLVYQLHPNPSDLNLTPDRSKELEMPSAALTDAQKAQKWSVLAALLVEEFWDWTYSENPPAWW